MATQHDENHEHTICCPKCGSYACECGPDFVRCGNCGYSTVPELDLSKIKPGDE